MFCFDGDVGTHGISLSAEPEMPEHNLEPPRFCRKALERILSDWSAVKCVLSTGHREAKAATATTGGGAAAASTSTSTSSAATYGGAADHPLYEDQVYLRAQSGTQRLDKFTHTLLVKCSVEVRRRSCRFVDSLIELCDSPLSSFTVSASVIYPHSTLSRLYT